MTNVRLVWDKTRCHMLSLFAITARLSLHCILFCINSGVKFNTISERETKCQRSGILMKLNGIFILYMRKISLKTEMSVSFMFCLSICVLLFYSLPSTPSLLSNFRIISSTISLISANKDFINSTNLIGYYNTILVNIALLMLLS